MNEKLIKVSSTTKPGKLAGSITITMKEDGTAEVAAMGAEPVNRAVKGIMIA